MNLAEIPDEIIIQEMIHRSVSDILSLCATSTRFAKICQGPTIWFQLLQRDFPDFSPEGVTDPRTEYIERSKLLVSLVASMSRQLFDDIMDYRGQESIYEDEEEEGEITVLGYVSYEQFLDAQTIAVSRLDLQAVRLINDLRDQILGVPVLDSYRTDVEKLSGAVFDASGRIVFIRGTETKYAEYRLRRIL